MTFRWRSASCNGCSRAGGWPTRSSTRRVWRFRSKRSRCCVPSGQSMRCRLLRWPKLPRWTWVRSPASSAPSKTPSCCVVSRARPMGQWCWCRPRRRVGNLQLAPTTYAASISKMCWKVGIQRNANISVCSSIDSSTTFNTHRCQSLSRRVDEFTTACLARVSCYSSFGLAACIAAPAAADDPAPACAAAFAIVTANAAAAVSSA